MSSRRVGAHQSLSMSTESPIAEESLPTERERDSARSRRETGTLRRKMAKRSYPKLLAPQDEDIPVAKMPRLMVPFPTTAEEAVTKTASLDAEEVIHFTYADADPMMALQPNTSASRAPPSIQRKDNTYKECIKEWPAVAAMAPLPTSTHLSGWHPSVYQTNGFTRMWAADQINLLNVLNGMNGYASNFALNPVQTTSPCWDSWSPRGSAWRTTIAQVAGITALTGMGTVSQGNVLETQQNRNHWYASRALDLLQTTTSPCPNGFHKAMDISPVDRTTGWTPEEAYIDWTAERKGKWTADEDAQLLRAAEKFAVTRWKAIAALIPGRTKKQCWNRWQYALDPSIARTTERTGKWLQEEDDKLVDAVEIHNGKNWDEVAKLVPSRTKRQCMDRWHKVLDTSIC